MIKDEVILGYTAKLPREAKEDSFYHIKSAHAQDQDLNGTVQILDDTNHQSYSLLCPISLTHQEIPVRTNSCRHVATFDLGSCIKALLDFDLTNCYSRLILKSKVDCALTCPICKAKDRLYVDGIIETFIKFNPRVEGFKFAENGQVVDCDGTSKMDHNKTIDLVSPLPFCELSQTTSPYFTLLAPVGSPPPFECSPLEKSTTAFQCSPRAFTFGPKMRIVTKSPLLVGLGKRDALPAPSTLNQTIDLASPPPFVTFSPMDLEKSPEPSKLNEIIASPDKDNSSLLHRSGENFSARVPFPLRQTNPKEKEDPSSSTAMTKSGWESPNPFLYCRSPLYSELYDQASAFAFPESNEELAEEAVFAAARRRFSTVDLDSPRPIF